MCLGFQFRRWIRSELYVRSRYASANEEVNVLRNYTLNVSRVRCSSVQKKSEQTYFVSELKKGRNFGAFIVLTSVKLCKLGDESTRISRASDEING